RGKRPQVNRIPVAGYLCIAPARVFRELHVKQWHEVTGIALAAAPARPDAPRGIRFQEGDLLPPGAFTVAYHARIEAEHPAVIGILRTAHHALDVEHIIRAQ